MNQKEELEIENYLHRMRFTRQSIKSYMYQIKNFIDSHPNAENYNYNEIVMVMEDITKHKPNLLYRIAILAAIKNYYDYLIECGKRDNHPCRSINIKHHRSPSVIHNDFFTSNELEQLMNREERFQKLKDKNQVIISLLIFQGVTSGEIANMKVQHINLDEGQIFVKESPDLTRRHLEMHPKQYKIFDQYINESRSKLLKSETDRLVIGMRGNPTSISEIGYVIEQFKSLYPDRDLNPGTIRQSVISNWLNEKKFPLELVQLMAGHKWISTTLRYKFTSHDEKRILINRFHPLG